MSLQPWQQKIYPYLEDYLGELTVDSVDTLRFLVTDSVGKKYEIFKSLDDARGYAFNLLNDSWDNTKNKYKEILYRYPDLFFVPDRVKATIIKESSKHLKDTKIKDLVRRFKLDQTPQYKNYSQAVQHLTNNDADKNKVETKSYEVGPNSAFYKTALDRISQDKIKLNDLLKQAAQEIIVLAEKAQETYILDKITNDLVDYIINDLGIADVFQYKWVQVFPEEAIDRIINDVGVDEILGGEGMSLPQNRYMIILEEDFKESKVYFECFGGSY